MSMTATEIKLGELDPIEHSFVEAMNACESNIDILLHEVIVQLRGMRDMAVNRQPECRRSIMGDYQRLIEQAEGVGIVVGKRAQQEIEEYFDDLQAQADLEPEIWELRMGRL